VSPESPLSEFALSLLSASSALANAGPTNQRAQKLAMSLAVALRPATPARKKQAIMEEWYRAKVTEAVPPLIAKWEMAMAAKVERFFVRRMKTRWGSCTPRTRRIRLNTELAKKSPELLEYVVVHEMVHLIERHHNDRFVGLMDRHLPNWRDLRKALNNPPPTLWIAPED
jgi:predicted metal-dependent hydrolase